MHGRLSTGAPALAEMAREQPQKVQGGFPSQPFWGDPKVCQRPYQKSTLQGKAGRAAQTPQVTILKGFYWPESKALPAPYPVPNAVLGVTQASTT